MLHGYVSKAAAVAGAFVHIGQAVRRAANMAELAMDPADVIDFSSARTNLAVADTLPDLCASRAAAVVPRTAHVQPAVVVPDSPAGSSATAGGAGDSATMAVGPATLASAPGADVPGGSRSGTSGAQTLPAAGSVQQGHGSGLASGSAGGVYGGGSNTAAAYSSATTGGYGGDAVGGLPDVDRYLEGEHDECSWCFMFCVTVGAATACCPAVSCLSFDMLYVLH